MKRVIVIQLIILTIGLSIGVTSGGVLSRDQLDIDINHYDLRIKVDTKRKMIAGYVDIKMKILDEIIKAPPTDGLWDDGRTDEGQLGLKYEELEEAMNNKNSPNYEKYIKIRKLNLHKMEPIPVCKIPK